MNDDERRERNAESREDGRPECYGDPRRVCPRDEEGIIQPQAECLKCGCQRTCLQTALRKDGVIRDSAVSSRVSGFFKRWSDQKLARTGPSGGKDS